MKALADRISERVGVDIRFVVRESIRYVLV